MIPKITGFSGLLSTGFEHLTNPSYVSESGSNVAPWLGRYGRIIHVQDIGHWATCGLNLRSGGPAVYSWFGVFAACCKSAMLATVSDGRVTFTRNPDITIDMCYDEHCRIVSRMPQWEQLRCLLVGGGRIDTRRAVSIFPELREPSAEYERDIARDLMPDVESWGMRYETRAALGDLINATVEERAVLLKGLLVTELNAGSTQLRSGVFMILDENYWYPEFVTVSSTVDKYGTALIYVTPAVHSSTSGGRRSQNMTYLGDYNPPT